MSAALAEARSLLFVPGNRPERFEKAVGSGADAVVLDLEDSVPAAERPGARAAIAQAWPRLAALGIPLVLRINSLATAEAPEDLALAGRLLSLDAVMLPKAESAEAVARVRTAAPGASVLPIVESAAGLRSLDDVAGAAGVIRLAVGHLDFMADTGIACGEDEAELAPLRFAVAVATRAAGLAPAVDGVTTQTGDEARLAADTRRAKRFGFGGKLCIHPRQVAPVHRAFAPSEDEIAWARRVVEADRASGGRAVQVDGRMVDRPVVLLAERTLARAAR